MERKKNEKVLQASLTGGVVQPVRLYYATSAEARLADTLAQLQCIEYEANTKSWIWLYEAEARNLRFDKPYSSIPKKKRPIVIGRLSLSVDNGLHIDLRTIHRATKAIEFFDKHIPRTIARLTHLAIVNRLFEASESASSQLDHLFQDVTETDPDALLSAYTPGVPLDISVKERAQKPLPAVEKLPVWYYEEGIKTIETTLMIRQMIAIQRWNGNTEY